MIIDTDGEPGCVGALEDGCVGPGRLAVESREVC